MEGDPRNSSKSLLKKYDIPIDHLSYEYVGNCTDKKELERIVRILRSGEEGFYPDLLKVTEDRLKKFAPDSRVLRLETPVLTKDNIPSDEWKEVENELLAWEKEMMIIDKSLDFEKGRIELVGTKDMPEVRKITKPEPKKATHKNEPSNTQNNIRIKSGDYASWDKFDVDKELIKIDVEEERREELNKKKKLEIKKIEVEKKVDINIDKDSYSSVEKQVLANQAKERGNECFKSGDFKNALTYYNISINLFDSVNAYNNRAMTYLKLNEYKEAVKDCNVVLQKEKTNTKALYRRATAYQNMANNSNNYDRLALQDLNEVVLLEPNNKMAQLGLQKLKVKLGIQTGGKKFRMPICENDQSKDKENKTLSYNNEKNFSDCSRGVLHNIDNLPLTYYGPSTSSFECQPHSMTHRALSGSLLASEILCKCNSSRPMQNPLCQKCGEAMCAPKPVSKAKKANFVSKPTAKTQNVTENTLQKLRSDEIKSKETYLKNTSPEVFKTGSSKEKEEICDEASDAALIANGKKTCAVVHKDNNIKAEALKVENSDKNLSVSVSKPKNEVQQEVSALENTSRSEGEVLDVGTRRTKPNESKNFKSLDSQISKETSNILDNEKCKEKTRSETVKVSELKDGERSGPSDGKSSSSSGKSKTKKKKPKNHRKPNLRFQDEWEKITPLRVVHADKYLHPTSVEPKIQTEANKKGEPEVNLTGINNFKAFVPNRQCLSIRAVETNVAGNHSNSPPFRKSTEPTAGDYVRPVSSNPETGTAFEGNKENVLKMSDSNVGGRKGEKLNWKNEGKEKPEKEDELSPYRFATRWEMLQKHDDAYCKRAEMIRSIGPSKLGEIIGVKLNCEMLVTLLECLEKQFVETEPDVVVDILKQLPQMPRFGLINMLLASKDKKVMKNLIEIVENKGFALEEIKKNLLSTS